MSGVAPNTFTGAIALMERLGARFATVIDVGSADGHFVVSHKALGLLKGAVPLNVDPLAIYEPSLQRVQADLGGAHRICALVDGEVEIATGAHPYWASTRPAGDAYGDRLSGTPEGTVRVRRRRLDDLVAEIGLNPPFLL